MPGSIRVSVLEAFDLPEAVEDGKYVSVKVSVGKREFQTKPSKTDGGKTPPWNSDFVFPVLNLRDNLVIALLGSKGDDISKHEIVTPSIVEKGFCDEVVLLKGGGCVHLKLSFVLTEEERRRIDLMRAAALKRREQEVAKQTKQKFPQLTEDNVTQSSTLSPTENQNMSVETHKGDTGSSATHTASKLPESLHQTSIEQQEPADETSGKFAASVLVPDAVMESEKSSAFTALDTGRDPAADEIRRGNLSGKATEPEEAGLNDDPSVSDSFHPVSSPPVSSPVAHGIAKYDKQSSPLGTVEKVSHEDPNFWSLPVSRELSILPTPLVQLSDETTPTAVLPLNLDEPGEVQSKDYSNKGHNETANPTDVCNISEAGKGLENSSNKGCDETTNSPDVCKVSEAGKGSQLSDLQTGSLESVSQRFDNLDTSNATTKSIKDKIKAFEKSLAQDVANASPLFPAQGGKLPTHNAIRKTKVAPNRKLERDVNPREERREATKSFLEGHSLSGFVSASPSSLSAEVGRNGTADNDKARCLSEAHVEGKPVLENRLELSISPSRSLSADMGHSGTAGDDKAQCLSDAGHGDGTSGLENPLELSDDQGCGTASREDKDDGRSSWNVLQVTGKVIVGATIIATGVFLWVSESNKRRRSRTRQVFKVKKRR